MKKVLFLRQNLSFMRLFHTALTLVATLSFLCPANAQGQKGVAHRALDRLHAQSRVLDPNAIYVPAPRWTLALTGDLRQASFSQKQDFALPSAKLSPSGELIIEEIPVSISANLKGKVGTGIGVQVGYGDLSLSLSKNLGGGRTVLIQNGQEILLGFVVGSAAPENIGVIVHIGPDTVYRGGHGVP